MNIAVLSFLDLSRSSREKRTMMRLARESAERVVGFEDECWWSRVAQPNLHSFSEAGEPLRLVEQPLAKDDPDPKAVSCYGLYLPELEKAWLRFVDGRPVSRITTRFWNGAARSSRRPARRFWC